MGNTALVRPEGKNIGVYLHWNGGNNSVTAFLEYCKMKQYRPFGGKYADSYGLARFIQVCSNFFGGTLCIGVEPVGDDSGEGLDNGIYTVGGASGWDMIDREPYHYSEGELEDFLVYIDSCQPDNEQFGKDYILAQTVEPGQLQVGDTVFIYDPDRGEKAVNEYIVVGFGRNGQICNGHKVEGVPYVNKYADNNGDYSHNPNNYIFEPVKCKGRSSGMKITDLLGKENANDS